MSVKNFGGSNAAHRRTIYEGCGYDAEDLKNKPHIGIANTYTEVNPAHIHFKNLVEVIKAGIWQAGGVPFEFGVPATCGNIAIGTDYLRYELAMRDVVAGSVELVSSIQLFDGLVLLASCDNIVPGMLLAAARLDIPALIFTGGPMQAGKLDNSKVVTSDVNEAVFGKVSKKEMDDKEIEQLEHAACPGVGACPVMGTANTMQILSEVLGLCLPYSSTVPAINANKKMYARKTGNRIVEMVNEGVNVSQIVTKEAIQNAIKVDMAIGGSTNATMHLISLGKELDIDISLQDFDTFSKEVPCIVNVRPSGTHTVDELYEQGGVPAILKQLEKLIELDCINAYGEKLSDFLTEVGCVKSDIIRSLSNPIFSEGGIAVLFGNLAENGAIIRTSSVIESMRYFKGPARVFNSDREAYEGVINNKISPGDVIVIRYEGPKGSPGMAEVMMTAEALVNLGLDTSVGLVTDGRFSGFNSGPIVGHISPEAAEGGMLALVADGDIIEVDIKNREINVDIDEKELLSRRKNLKPFVPRINKGFMKLYAQNCLSADEGAAMQIPE